MISSPAHRTKQRPGALAVVGLLALVTPGRAELAPQTGSVEVASSSPEEAGERFAAALTAFRAGEVAARDLDARARAFRAATGRDDGLKVAAYYIALGRAELERGVQLEKRFDDLRKGVRGDDADENALRMFLEEADRATDVIPAAHSRSLLARLIILSLIHI